MNEFSRYIKVGMNPKNRIYKIEPFINPFFEKLSKEKYTKDISLKFHFEIRIDTKDFQWGDDEGVSNVKLFLKKGFIGASITILDEKVETQEDVFSFLKVYLKESIELMIERLKNEKIEIDDTRLLNNFDKYFDNYFKTS